MCGFLITAPNMVNLTTMFWVTVNMSTNRSRPPLLNGYLLSIAFSQVLSEMFMEFVSLLGKCSIIWKLLFYLFFHLDFSLYLPTIAVE